MSTLTALIPIISWMLLNAATCILLNVPVPSRLYAVPAILIPAAISFKTIQHLNFLPGLPDLWGSITLIGLIHFLSLLYIKEWTFRRSRQTRKPSTLADTWLSRSSWTHMYQVGLNPRFIRVPYKHVILSDRDTGRQVKSTAIHKPFSSRRILWLLVKIALYFVLNHLATTHLLGIISISDFAPAKAGLLRRSLGQRVYNSTYPSLDERACGPFLDCREWYLDASTTA